MIVQTAPEGAPRFVVFMAEHMALAARLARAFGNDGFEPVAPEEEGHYVVAHHDAGWAELDSRVLIDPGTGLPYDLAETPFELLMATSRGSPDFNERRHPFCGLLSSMHSWGLYNGRYGLSGLVLLDKVAERNLEAARAMLGHEEARQARLRGALREDPATASWVAEDRLMQSYKQLQFFDTLALYFNRVHEGARGPETFPRVPRSAAEDADVEIAPLGGGAYAVAPWPFSGASLTLAFEGRYMTPLAAGADGAAAAAALPAAVQEATLRPA